MERQKWPLLKELSETEKLTEYSFECGKLLKMKDEAVRQWVCVEDKLSSLRVDVVGSQRFCSEHMYQNLLLKQLLLSYLKLLMCSVELYDDPVWCIERLGLILRCIESYNKHLNALVGGLVCDAAFCTLADVNDTFTLVRGCILVEIISKRNTELLKWVEFECDLIKGLVLSMLINTSLMKTVRDDLQPLVSRVQSWKHFAQLMDDIEEIEISNVLEGRVWQEVGRRLVPRIQGLLLNKKEIIDNISLSVTDIEKYPSAHTCFQYVINMVTVSNQINECFKATAAMLPKLSSNTSPSCVEEVSGSRLVFIGNEITEMRKKLTRPQDRCINNERDTQNKRHLWNGGRTRLPDTIAVASETNRLRLSYTLISAVHTSSLCVTNCLIHSLQQCISTDSLSQAIQLVFSVTPSVSEKVKEMVRECGMVTAPLLYLPKECSQYWVCTQNRLTYSRLHDSYLHNEDVISLLCEAFLKQWRGKCHHLLDIVFPNSKVWKKIESKKYSPDDTPTVSSYITPIKEQLVLPLLTACRCLSPAVQQMSVYLTLSTLLLEFRDIILKRLKPSPFVSRQLLMDYHSLISFFTDRDSPLHPHTQQMIPLLTLYLDIERGLIYWCGEEINEQQETGEEDEGIDIVKDVQTRVLKFSSLRHVIEEIGWLDNNQWKI